MNTQWELIQLKATHKGERFALFCGDAVSMLRAMPSESIDTCLTSPPYWQARDYGAKDQIGLEESIDEYIEKLVDVFREVHRLLKPTGTLWLNLGDRYITGAHAHDPAHLKNKQLALVPFRVAIALQMAGWWVRNSMVWHKPNAQPSSVTDRLTNTWEPVFLLSKSEKYYFNLDAVRVPHLSSHELPTKDANQQLASKAKAIERSDLRAWLSSPRHRATVDGVKVIRRRPNKPDAVELATALRYAAKLKRFSVKKIADMLDLPHNQIRHYFRTDVQGARVPSEEIWNALKTLLNLGDEFDEAMTIELGDNAFRNHPNGKNPGDVQSFALSTQHSLAKEHFATMPLSLARWCLAACLPPNGICLDPFIGIGTTGCAAIEQGGSIVGVDIRADFLLNAEKRLTSIKVLKV